MSFSRRCKVTCWGKPSSSVRTSVAACGDCAGDFIDDYAVDEIERNDESFVFVVRQRPARQAGASVPHDD
jgi:hypothetical protein